MYFCGRIIKLTEPTAWRDDDGKTHYVQTCILDSSRNGDEGESIAVSVWSESIRNYLTSHTGRWVKMYLRCSVRQGLFNSIKCTSIKVGSDTIK